MTVYAITDTKKEKTGIAPTYLQVGAGAAGAAGTAFSNTGFIPPLHLTPPFGGFPLVRKN